MIYMIILPVYNHHVQCTYVYVHVPCVHMCLKMKPNISEDLFHTAQENTYNENIEKIIHVYNPHNCFELPVDSIHVNGYPHLYLISDTDHADILQQELSKKVYIYSYTSMYTK